MRPAVIVALFIVLHLLAASCAPPRVLVEGSEDGVDNWSLSLPI